MKETRFYFKIKLQRVQRHTNFLLISQLAFQKCIKVNWNIHLIDRCLDNSEDPPIFHAINCMFQKMQNVKCRVLQNADLENRKMGNAV